MVSSLLLFFSLIGAGAAVAAVYRPFPGLLGLSAASTNPILGALAGGLLAALVRGLWRRTSALWTHERAEIRVFNALLGALGGSLFGIVSYFSLEIAFPTSGAVRVSQGALLLACVLLGTRIGFALEGSIRRPRCGERMDARETGSESIGGKLLDTSIIIDGRIAPLVATGFIEGEILVPEFILAELQNIADSSNSLRRRKGRRGLDILNEIMHDESVSLRILSKDYPSIREVDHKLLRLAKEEGATLVTTDYNLNRVAQVEGVTILNVNELANAVRPRYLPGEGISVEVIDRGEEINQGIGYLDDGTMVVVENGRRHIGRTIKATVKSTLQTEAGRMLFAEPVGAPTRWNR